LVFVAQLQNPFSPLGARLTSLKFQAELDKLVQTFNAKNA
jgi:hypothetical protein